MCGTVRVHAHSNMQPDERSTSDPMFIRVSPLLVYLNINFLHIWLILSPDVTRPVSLKIRHCAHANFFKLAIWTEIHLKPHVYKGFPFISLSKPPFFTCLTYVVARCERCPSNPMFIRVSLLLVYLHPLFLHIWHSLSPGVPRSVSLYIRHCAYRSSVKHATRWKFHLRPHVYKGFPFISLSTPLKFDIFCRPWLNLPPRWTCFP